VSIILTFKTLPSLNDDISINIRLVDDKTTSTTSQHVMPEGGSDDNDNNDDDKQESSSLSNQRNAHDVLIVSLNGTNNAPIINHNNDDDDDNADESTKDLSVIGSANDSHENSNTNPIKSHEMHTCMNTQNETNTFKLMPSFIIIGQRSCGTSALYHILKKHPNILASKKPEPHYFDNRIEKLEKILDSPHGPKRDRAICEQRYDYPKFMFDNEKLSLFNNNGTDNETSSYAASFEKTPKYFDHWKVPRLINEFVPHTKIILVLRDPVALLGQGFVKYTNDENKDIVAYTEKIKKEFEFAKTQKNPDPNPKLQKLFNSALLRGRYVVSLKNWLEYYTLGENMLVLPYEDFKSKPQSFLDEIADFVGYPRFDFPDNFLRRDMSPDKRKRRKGGYVNRENTIDYIPDDFKKELYTFFEPYNEQLADIVGERFRGIWNATV